MGVFGLENTRIVLHLSMHNMSCAASELNTSLNINTDHERELLNIHKQDQCFSFPNLGLIIKNLGILFLKKTPITISILREFSVAPHFLGVD